MPVVTVQGSSGNIADVDAGGAVSTRSKTKIQIDTIINAQSVAAGGNTGFVSLGVTTETEVWVLINIDQQPWTASTEYPWIQSGSNSKALFPERLNVATAFANTITPAASVLLGMPFDSLLGLTVPANLTEAISVAWPWPLARIRISNGSAVLATVTVRVYRVWRTK